MAVRFIKCTMSKPSLFDNKQLEFAPGITLIKGKNGSGKSYLAKALVEGIWRYFTKDNIKNADGTDSLIDDAYMDLCFSLSNKESNSNYRFRYQSDLLSVFNISENEQELAKVTVKNGEQITPDVLNDSLLEAFISKSSIKSFLSTSFVPSLSDTSGPQDILDYKSVRSLILNDESGFYARYLLLNEQYNRESISEARLFATIDEKQRSLNLLKKEIEIIHIKNQRINKLEKEKETILDEIASSKKEIESLEKRNQVLEQILTDIKKVERFNEKLNKIKHKLSNEQSKIDQIKALEQEIATNYSRFDFSELSDDYLEEVQAIFREIIDNNEKIGSWVVRKRTFLRRFYISAGIMGVAMLMSAFGFLSFNSFSLQKSSGFLIMLLLASLVFLVGSSLWCLIFFNINKKKIKKLNENKQALDERLRTSLKENSFSFDNYKLNELYDILLTYFEDYTGYNDNLNEINTIKSTMTGSDTIKGIKHDMKSLKNSGEVLQGKINKNIELLKVSSNDASKIENILGLVSETKATIETILDSIKTKEEILSRIEKEKIASKEEKDEFILAQQVEIEGLLNKLNEKKETVFFITDIMKQAVMRSEKEQFQKLIDNTLSRFHFITDNQFKTQITAQTVNDFIVNNGNVENMNPSAVHTLILSIKLALTEFMLGEEISIPLILDDPFLLMDDERINRLMEQLREIAASRQITIFTNRKVANGNEKTIEL